MVTIFTEHTRSRNMEATFKGNPKTIPQKTLSDGHSGIMRALHNCDMAKVPIEKSSQNLICVDISAVSCIP